MAHHDRPGVEQIVGEAAFKCGHIVLGARRVPGAGDNPNSGAEVASHAARKRAARWFLLEHEEVPEARSELEPWRTDPSTPLVIEVYTRTCAWVEVPGVEPNAEVLLERWVIQHSRDGGGGGHGERPGSGGPHGRSRSYVDDASVYKRCVLLTRVLYTQARTLPAQRVAKAARECGGGSGGVSLAARVVRRSIAVPEPTGSTAHAVAPQGGGQDGAWPRDVALRGGRPGSGGGPGGAPDRLAARMIRFAFARVDTPGGRAFTVEVDYLPGVRVRSAGGYAGGAGSGAMAAPSLPRVIPEYLSASPQSRGSMAHAGSAGALVPQGETKGPAHTAHHASAGGHASHGAAPVSGSQRSVGSGVSGCGGGPSGGASPAPPSSFTMTHGSGGMRMLGATAAAAAAAAAAAVGSLAARSPLAASLRRQVSQGSRALTGSFTGMYGSGSSAASGGVAHSLPSGSGGMPPPGTAAAAAGGGALQRAPSVVRHSWSSREVRAMLPLPDVDIVPLLLVGQQHQHQQQFGGSMVVASRPPLAPASSLPVRGPDAHGCGAPCAPPLPQPSSSAVNFGAAHALTLPSGAAGFLPLPHSRSAADIHSVAHTYTGFEPRVACAPQDGGGGGLARATGGAEADGAVGLRASASDPVTGAAHAHVGSLPSGRLSQSLMVARGESAPEQSSAPHAHSAGRGMLGQALQEQAEEEAGALSRQHSTTTHQALPPHPPAPSHTAAAHASRPNSNTAIVPVVGSVSSSAGGWAAMDTAWMAAQMATLGRRDSGSFGCSPGSYHLRGLPSASCSPAGPHLAPPPLMLCGPNSIHTAAAPRGHAQGAAGPAGGARSVSGGGGRASSGGEGGRTSSGGDGSGAATPLFAYSPAGGPGGGGGRDGGGGGHASGMEHNHRCGSGAAGGGSGGGGGGGVPAALHSNSSECGGLGLGSGIDSGGGGCVGAGGLDAGGDGGGGDDDDALPFALDLSDTLPPPLPTMAPGAHGSAARVGAAAVGPGSGSGAPSSNSPGHHHAVLGAAASPVPTQAPTASAVGTAAAATAAALASGAPPGMPPGALSALALMAMAAERDVAVGEFVRLVRDGNGGGASLCAAGGGGAAGAPPPAAPPLVHHHTHAASFTVHALPPAVGGGHAADMCAALGQLRASASTVRALLSAAGE